PYCVGRLSHSEPDGRAPVFFQAEDGIRDFHVTGVQTCALPILRTCGPASGLVAVPGVPPEDLHKQAQQFDAVTLAQDITMLEELRRLLRTSQAGRALLDATLVRLALRSGERRGGQGRSSRRPAD